LALPDQLRLEAALAVARHLDGYRTCLRQDGLAALAVAGIAAVPAGRIMLAVAEVIVELAIERRFDHHLRQPRQQPTLTGEPQPLGAGPLGQLPHQLVAGHTRLRLRRIQGQGSLLIINHISHRCLLLPQELHRKIYSPDPERFGWWYWHLDETRSRLLSPKMRSRMLWGRRSVQMCCPHKRPGANAFVFGPGCNRGMHMYPQDRLKMCLEVLGMDAASDPPDASYSAATFGVALGPVKADPERS